MKDVEKKKKCVCNPIEEIRKYAINMMNIMH